MIKNSITSLELLIKMNRKLQGNIFQNRKWFLEVTTRCSGRCPGCLRRLVSKEQKFSDLDPIHLKKIPLTDTVNICGIMGEPTCWTPLLDTLEQNQWAHITLHTNGVNHGKEYWYRLANALSYEKNNIVVFAMDGLKDTYNIYRKNLSWDRLYTNMKHFIRAGGNAVIQFIKFDENEHQEKDIIKFAKNIGCRSLIVKRNFAERRTRKQIHMYCVPREQRIIYMNSEGLLFPCCHIMGYYTAYGSAIFKGLSKKFTHDIESSLALPAFNLDITKYKICRTHCSFDKTGDYIFVNL